MVGGLFTIEKSGELNRRLVFCKDGDSPKSGKRQAFRQGTVSVGGQE